MISVETAVFPVVLVAVAFLVVCAFVQWQQVDTSNFVWIIYIHVLASNIAIELVQSRNRPGKSAAPRLTLVDLLLLIFVEFAIVGQIASANLRTRMVDPASMI
jgi:hypothetical protein